MIPTSLLTSTQLQEKSLKYKDPCPTEGKNPKFGREFEDLMTEEMFEKMQKDFEEEMKKSQGPSKEDIKLTGARGAEEDGELGLGGVLGGLGGGADMKISAPGISADVDASKSGLIQEVDDRTGKVKKTASKVVKKGFLNSKKAKEEGLLYGENGSGEGVLPENAGDPLGYIPKKLRNMCNVVDTSNPEYQAKEAEAKKAKEVNDMNDEFKNTMKSDMDKWVAKSQNTYDRWDDDKPCGGDEDVSGVSRKAKGPKYSVDYSRFDDIKDPDAQPQEAGPERDYYFDSKGNVIQRKQGGAMPGAGPTAKIPSASNGKQLNGDQQKQLREMQAALGDKSVNPFADMKPEEMLKGLGVKSENELKDMDPKTLQERLDGMMKGAMGGMGGPGGMGGQMQEMAKSLGLSEEDMKMAEQLMGSAGTAESAEAMQKAAAAMSGKLTGEQKTEFDAVQAGFLNQVRKEKLPHTLEENEAGTAYVVTVPQPEGVESLADIAIDMAEDKNELVLSVEDVLAGFGKTVVKLARDVDGDGIKAKSSSKKKRLTITIPFK